MARHRHIRSLDIPEEYDNQFSRDDSSDENSLSSHIDELAVSNSVPEKSILFDFIDDKVKKRSDSCYEVSKKKRKRIGKTDKDEISTIPEKISASTKNENELKPMKRRELMAIENSPIESSRIENTEYEHQPSSQEVPTSNRMANLESSQNALAEYESRNSLSKELINIIVIGHVDAGKSTLFGNLLVTLGYESEALFRKWAKEQKAATQYAWLLDEMPEERQRGVTMDIAFRKIITSEREVVLLDSPGHRDFIANMISGTTEADSAVLVIDAGIGNFEAGFELGGQTKEHVLLARSLGVLDVIVAVNKMDSVCWDEKRYLEIVTAMTTFLKGIGFRKYTFLPCSGLLGVNIVESPKGELPWYNGVTLLEAINTLEPPRRQILEPLRMFVSESTDKDKGVKVSGRIVCGHVKRNDKVVIMPLNSRCSVANITIDEEQKKYGFAGDLVDLQVVGTDSGKMNVSKGDVICCSQSPIHSVSIFKAKLIVFNILLPLTKGSLIQLHYQGHVTIGVITKLLSLLQKKDGKILKNRPRFLLSNSCANVEIKVSKPICLELYEQSKELGRFLLRSEGNTIAAGVVTEISGQNC